MPTITHKQFYLIAAIVGTVLPWLFFGTFFALNGFNIPLFLAGLFNNGAAAGFSTDVLLSIVVFWVWSLTDARKHAIQAWWLVIPTSCLVGLSLALPLYLYIREGKLSASS